MLWTSGHYVESATTRTGRIVSRIGLEADAHLYRASDDLKTEVLNQNSKTPISAVFVDEAQFLTEAQVWQLARVCDDVGIPVLCYGLRTDFQGELFPGSAALLSIADELREAKTICHCGRKATMTARTDEIGNVLTEGAQVSVAKGKYVSLCRQHWTQAVTPHSK